MTDDDRPLLHRVIIAHSFSQRLFGLLPFRNLEPHEGMFFPHTRWIHTFAMRFSIDVAYLDREGRVLYVETLPPQRIGSFLRATAHVVEAPKGALQGLPPGTKVLLTPLQRESTPSSTKSQTGSGAERR
ncbi:MAG: DUF192 domain-containing protein [Clostridiales bacterium]|nr:DUF192 domain-containing protein [Clostridiales bacterium]